MYYDGWDAAWHAVWLAPSLVFADEASRMDVLGLTWMALVLTVTVELTWNLSSKTFLLTHIHTYLPFLYNIDTCTQKHTKNKKKTTVSTVPQAFSSHQQTPHTSVNQETAPPHDGSTLFL